MDQVQWGSQTHAHLCGFKGNTCPVSKSLWPRTFQHSFQSHKVAAINFRIAAFVVMSRKKSCECFAGQEHALQLPPIPRHMSGTRSTWEGEPQWLSSVVGLQALSWHNSLTASSALPGPTWWCAATSTRSPAASAAASSDLSHLQVTTSSLMGVFVAEAITVHLAGTDCCWECSTAHAPHLLCSTPSIPVVHVRLCCANWVAVQETLRLDAQR